MCVKWTIKKCWDKTRLYKEKKKTQQDKKSHNRTGQDMKSKQQSEKQTASQEQTEIDNKGGTKIEQNNKGKARKCNLTEKKSCTKGGTGQGTTKDERDDKRRHENDSTIM